MQWMLNIKKTHLYVACIESLEMIDLIHET